jgi:uncharacterized protein YcfL
MKLKISKKIVSGILFGFVFCIACSTKNQDNHTHEEGLVCEEHKDRESMPEQEHFTVEADAIVVEADSIVDDHHSYSHSH